MRRRLLTIGVAALAMLTTLTACNSESSHEATHSGTTSSSVAAQQHNQADATFAHVVKLNYYLLDASQAATPCAFPEASGQGPHSRGTKLDSGLRFQHGLQHDSVHDAHAAKTANTRPVEMEP